MGKKINVAGELNAATEEGIVADSAQVRETNHGNVQAAVTAILLRFASYYTKSETYTKAEVDSLVAIDLKMEVVPSKPTTNIDPHTIYLVPKATPGTDNAKDEWVYINNNWEKIGDTEIDLSGYVQKPSSPVSGTAYLYKNGSMTAADAADIPFVNSGTSFDPSVTNVDLALEWLDAHKAPAPSNISDNKQYIMKNGSWTEIAFPSYSAGQISYDGELSHLLSSTVQGAIDELAGKFTATSISFSGSSYFEVSITTVYQALDFLGKAAIGAYSVEDDLESLTDASTISIDEDDLGLLPRDGYHYYLGSVDGLVFSNNMGAMKLGTTLHFIASGDFVMILPYSGTDKNDEPFAPEVPARIVNAEKLECMNGCEYVLTITCVCGQKLVEGSLVMSPINLFNLQTLSTPTASSNGLDE